MEATVADDDKVINGIAPRDLEAALRGRQIVGACRKGKQLWLDMGQSSPALMLHFGASRCCANARCTGCACMLCFALQVSNFQPQRHRVYCFTAGMTGCLVVKGVDAVKYVNAKLVDPHLWPPKYALSLLVVGCGLPFTIFFLWKRSLTPCLQVLQDRT